VVFDEDDPLGEHYYDASVGIVRAPSELRLTGPFNGKLAIVTNQAASGDHSGLLEWKSAPGGDWLLLVASPGWTRMDLSAHQFLELKLNAPAPLPAAVLPRLRLESTLNFSSANVELGSFLAEGVDDNPVSWQTIRIPLRAFEPYGRFALSQFKGVVFSQDAADDRQHTLWFDAIRVVSTNPPPQIHPPPPPANLIALPGDRTVTLSWNAPPSTRINGYHVFRSTSPDGDWSRISRAPVTVSGSADTSVANHQQYFYRIRAINAAGESADSAAVSATPAPFANDAAFLELVQRTAFNYFWHEANPANGLVRDRSQPFSTASIAATGFGLTAIGIGVERGWITRAQGLTRTRNTLQTLSQSPQGTNLSGTIGHQGWFYHFLEMETATRAGRSELSSIDTTLLLAGVLYSREYFNGDNPEEKEIRDLANRIFDRVDWHWMADGGESLTMGWHPERGFLTHRWRGYNEAMILYLLGLGASKQPLPPKHWRSWTSTYKWQTHYGQSFVVFPPHFGHQYSHCWIDFRGIADDYLRGKEIDYFENSRRATLAQRAYAIANPGGFPGYGENVWGLTACDGPGTPGKFGYMARGGPPPENDDGTIAPTAAGASLPFTPTESLAALRHFYHQFRERVWCGYGFRDAFNLEADWWATDVIGIDQGPILLMIENHRSGHVWRVFMSSPAIQRGLERAGFQPLRADRRLEPTNRPSDPRP
jgi:hypothetical protein